MANIELAGVLDTERAVEVWNICGRASDGNKVKLKSFDYHHAIIQSSVLLRLRRRLKAKLRETTPQRDA